MRAIIVHCLLVSFAGQPLVLRDLDAVVLRVASQRGEVRRRPAHVLLDEVSVHQPDHIVVQMVSSERGYQTAFGFNQPRFEVATLAPQERFGWSSLTVVTDADWGKSAATPCATISAMRGCGAHTPWNRVRCILGSARSAPAESPLRADRTSGTRRTLLYIGPQRTSASARNLRKAGKCCSTNW